jgi:FAD-dependent oxidoreductase family protein
MNRRAFLLSSAAATSRLLAKNTESDCDVAVVGGGVGGFAAAIAACRNGMKVVLSEETKWIGGQLTSQAVPPDEHPWIESFGSTRSYRDYRTAVRDYYRRYYPLSEAARKQPNLNPGNGTVSRLTHEFRVSVAVLEAMLAPYEGSGQLTILRRHVPRSATVSGDRVTSVVLLDLDRQVVRTVTARYFIDATELGDLIALTKTESVTGAESQKQTGELHACSESQPGNSQSFTYCFAVDYLEGEDHVIERPADYAFWRDYVPRLNPAWSGPLLSWSMCDPETVGLRKAYFLPNPKESKAGPGLNLWLYRRIADRTNFQPGTYHSDITLVNWPQNDYWLGDLVTADEEKRRELLRTAKQLSLSFLYWMQTDCPRPDGGHGWAGLRLRKDIVDTEDGLAKTAYIREARRIQAEFTILEQHVGTQMRSKALRKPAEECSAEQFADSVGIGCYRIDLHPSAGGTNYIDVSSLPFQIPLGALIPKRIENLIPGCKNIGTTHITNGCYRLHPVEWNIGEAAGALAAYAVGHRTPPRAIRNTKNILEDFQSALTHQGVELAWPRIHPV